MELCEMMRKPAGEVDISSDAVGIPFYFLCGNLFLTCGQRLLTNSAAPWWDGFFYYWASWACYSYVSFGF